MISNEQLNANIRNSQKSTGPKSDSAKRKVSLNSLKHGFAGQTCFVPEHCRAVFSAEIKGGAANGRDSEPKTRAGAPMAPRAGTLPSDYIIAFYRN